jgi:reactive intermediate/imine deaminase
MKTSFFTCLSVIIILINKTHAQTHQMNSNQQPREIVKAFLQIVRSGKNPERAVEFMADTVLANQMNAEKQETIKRTPHNYLEHVKEFKTLYGPYEFEITELIANDNKVYARWKQTGKHLADIDQFKATGLPLIEIGSAVYRVENGKIAEYWIQTDRKGFDLQLQQNEQLTTHKLPNRLPFTDAVALGETLYISGQIGTDDLNGKLINTDFKAEANQVMKNLGSVLQKHNLTYSNLINVTIYLTTMDNYDLTNEVYQKYFNGLFPARVCIAVKELPLQANIEISAIARIGNK